MNTQIATQKPRSQFEVELSQYEPQLAAVLPAHITVEKFNRVVITAVNLNPDLLQAERRSLFVSCVRSAQDGLVPDGREAALVIFNKKNKRSGQFEKHVQYMPMVFGVLKRMRNSGDINSIAAYIVNEHDEFNYELGDEPKIIHRPALRNAGPPIAVYAIAKLSNGETQREVMTVDEVERARAVSRAKDDGPWTAWWGEMAKKTVIKRMSKRLPLSSDLERIIGRDEDAREALDREAPRGMIGVSRPQRSAFMPPVSNAAEDIVDSADDPNLASAAGNQQETTHAEQAPPAAVQHDAETGEVLDPERPHFIPVPVKDGVSDWTAWCSDMREAMMAAEDEDTLLAIRAQNKDTMLALSTGGKGGRAAADRLQATFTGCQIELRRRAAAA